MEILASVVAATALLGWPHAPTYDERVEVTRAVVQSELSTHNALGTVMCRFRSVSVSRPVCGVQAVTREGGKRRVVRYKAIVRIWEDGSYRIVLPGFPAADAH